MISHELLTDKARRWEETIDRSAGDELVRMDSSIQEAIRYRVDISGAESKEQVTRIGYRFYQDLEKHLRHASVQDAIVEDQLRAVGETVATTDSLLSTAVFATGQFLLKIQSEPQLSDMPQGFKRTYITSRARNITQLLASPQTTR